MAMFRSLRLTLFFERPDVQFVAPRAGILMRQAAERVCDFDY
jgi:hypothetical protein